MDQGRHFRLIAEPGRGGFGPPFFLENSHARVVCAMGRSAGVVHPFLGLTFGCIVALLAYFMAGSVNAAEHIPRGSPVPQSIRWVNATATGASARASASWTYAGTTTYHNFPVPVGSGTIGGAAKAAIRRGLPVVGWGLVLRDIVNGAGWAISELQDQVVVPGEDQQPLGSSAWCITFANPNFPVSGTRCTSSKGDVPAMFGRVTGFQVSHAEEITANSGRVYFYWPGLTYTNNISYSLVTQPAWEPSWNANPGGVDTPVSDYDLGQLVKQYPEVFNAVMIDPQTGAPIRTPELMDALADLAEALNAANGVTDPPPATPPSDDLADPTPSQTEWPEFCNWATTVCDFIDWVRAEDTPSDNPEVEWEEELPPVQSDWSSGLGGGSCPPPVTFTISVAGGSASPEFSYEPICNFATTMKPVVIALAAIVAALIVAGVRASKDA